MFPAVTIIYILLLYFVLCCFICCVSDAGDSIVPFGKEQRRITIKNTHLMSGDMNVSISLPSGRPYLHRCPPTTARAAAQVNRAAQSEVPPAASPVVCGLRLTVVDLLLPAAARAVSSVLGSVTPGLSSVHSHRGAQRTRLVSPAQLT